MICASCVGRVERALRAVPGVTDATVDLANERAEVTGVRSRVHGPVERVGSGKCATSAVFSAQQSVRRDL